MKKVKFWVLTAVTVLLMGVELFFAYVAVGDLSEIVRMIASIWGVSRLAVPLAAAVILALVFFTSHYSYCKYTTVYNDQPTYTAYFSQILYDRPDRFWWGRGLPKHISPIIASVGYSLLYTTLVLKACSVLDWVSTWFDIRWLASVFSVADRILFGYFDAPRAFFDVLSAVVVFGVCLFYWFYKEFKKQKNADEAAEPTEAPTRSEFGWVTAIAYVLLLVTVFYASVWGAEAYERHLIQERYHDEINSAHQMARNVTMIQLLSNPEKYDGKLVRVVGVGNLKFEGDCIALSREDLKYGAGHKIRIVLGERAIPYAEAQAYNGKYVIVEGFFDMDYTGPWEAFQGAIKDVSRYQLWEDLE